MQGQRRDPREEPLQLPFDYRERSGQQVGIEALWTYATEVGQSVAISHIVLPDGCMDLIWRAAPSGAAAGWQIDLLVAGPSATAQCVDVGPGTNFVGLRFAPGWGGACLGLDAASLAGQVVPADSCGPELALLAADLAGASKADAAELLLRFAATKAASVRLAPRVLEAIRLMCISGGRIGATTVAATVGLSPRALRREVLAAVGLAPKPLARVLRFRRSLRLRKEDRSLGLAAIALESGYADQAHMTREYRELGGFSPGRFPPLLVS